MLVEEHIRHAVDAEVANAKTGVLLGVAEISQAAKKRDRRQRFVGGFSTMLLICFAFLGVAAMRGEGDTTAVFATDSEAPSAPAYLIRSDDRYIGLSPVNTFELDDLGNATFELVTSPDGTEWERVEESAPLSGLAFQLTERDGVFYLVSSELVETVADSEESLIDGNNDRNAEGETGEDQALQDESGEDRAGEERFTLSTSTDLVSWQEFVFEIPDERVVEVFGALPMDIEVIDGSALVLFQEGPTSLSLGDGLEALGYSWDSVCMPIGTSYAGPQVRICGQEKNLALAGTGSTARSIGRFLLRIDDDGVEEVRLPDINRVADPMGPQPVLYRTPDGVGISGYQAFESTDGIEWELVATKRDVRLMMAVRDNERMAGARGPERVYRTNFTVGRVSDNDIALGMAYSADDGETWTPTSVDHLFDDANTQPNWFSELTASEAGWVFLVQRNLLNQPEVQGVELESPGGLGSYTITTKDGYELSGSLPFGAARLIDPDGRLVRSWDVLEPSNPAWSGFEMTKGKVIALDDNDDPLAEFTADQWGTLLDLPGANRYDIVFSSDGIDWSIIDSGTLLPTILAMGENELIVQRRQLGVYSLADAPIDVIKLPTPSN